MSPVLSYLHVVLADDDTLGGYHCHPSNLSEAKQRPTEGSICQMMRCVMQHFNVTIFTHQS
jgi:hypothetical protein